MKLIFKKNEKSEISVTQAIDGNEAPFSYVEMIKELIKAKKMDEPDISAGFTTAEVNSINSMVSFINKDISEKEEEQTSKKKK
jgi:hypothetical protein